MPYKVELRYLSGWNDAGWTCGLDEESEPTRFETVAGAEAELAEFFANVKDAVAVGNMDTEANPEDYRIVEVNDQFPPDETLHSGKINLFYVILP